MKRTERIHLVAGLVLIVAGVIADAAAGQSSPSNTPTVAFVRVESPAKRMQYLARAEIWRDPGQLTPERLLAGPPLNDKSGVAEAPADRPFPCTFAGPGKTMGGNTPKFSCRTASGETIRVKYSDESTKSINREVFSLVGATRLLWALGFNADPVYPITVECHDCPQNPMSGSGTKAQRLFMAVYQPQFVDPAIVDEPDHQGWRWGELDDAINSLPDGELKARQRQHFDALMLLGVFLQHGDRKPEQQRLACRGMLNLQAGEFRPRDNARGQLAVFFERPGATACDFPDVTVQDIGATFGGAGRTTNATTAKMNLDTWASREIFHGTPDAGRGAPEECHGRLTVSMAAGEGSLGNPRIGESGRVFLLEQLRRLTDDHLRAIFTAARVNQMGLKHSWRDPENGQVYTATDAWVAAFKHKVHQIERRTCAP